MLSFNMLSFNMLSFNTCPAGMDLLGAPVFTKDFVVSGTCTPNLHGMCEAMYRPDMVRSIPFQILSTWILSHGQRMITSFLPSSTVFIRMYFTFFVFYFLFASLL